MKYVLFLALLFAFALSSSAQTETCPRVWRSGDTLWTDPAPQIQWLREGAAIPDANRNWLVPTEAGSYAVQTTGTPSEVHAFGAGYVIAGYVFDELHRPVEGAAVRRGAFSATTDEKGRFTLEINEGKPAERTPVVLVVEKEGYWRSASRQYVSAQFRTTETQIMLHGKRVTNRVDATKGGEMAYRGFTLQLPPNAVQTESGAPYSGTILLSVEGTTPSDPDFGLRMPGGDFSAVDESGNDVMLYSYGYLSAEMTTESGEKLELRPEARATLRFYLPYTETNRPDSVPLWHFNPETAVWEQGGWSHRNGSVYEGQVPHFSSWNTDRPAERSTVRGRVIDCTGEPVKSGWVRVGQRAVISDNSGRYQSFVPGGLTFDAWAANDTLRSITVPVREERTLEDLTGVDFSGFAVWNPVSNMLNTYLTGNVPENLRLSIDGGQSWTLNREFAEIAAAPKEVRLEGSCLEQLRVVVLPKASDCRKLSWSEVHRQTLYVRASDALAAEQAYHITMLVRSFQGEWKLLTSLPCLQKLLIVDNRLTHVTDEIDNISLLQVLDLSINQLTELPNSIGNLTQLRNLYLRQNQISRLPESIGNLHSLTALNLSYNQLTTLPENIGSLSNLDELSVSSNDLEYLPASIGNLSRLLSLSLNDNQLTDLPASIANLANTLVTLNLRNNPIPVERRAAIQAMLPNTRIYWE